MSPTIANADAPVGAVPRVIASLPSTRLRKSDDSTRVGWSVMRHTSSGCVGADTLRAATVCLVPNEKSSGGPMGSRGWPRSSGTDTSALETSTVASQ